MTQGKSMGRVLDEVVALDPDRTALIVGGVATSYAALEEAIADAAAGLGRAGVERGWRIPLVDDASVLAVAALIGGDAGGGVDGSDEPPLDGRGAGRPHAGSRRRRRSVSSGPATPRSPQRRESSRCWVPVNS